MENKVPKIVGSALLADVAAKLRRASKFSELLNFRQFHFWMSYFLNLYVWWQLYICIYKFSIRLGQWYLPSKTRQRFDAFLKKIQAITKIQTKTRQNEVRLKRLEGCVSYHALLWSTCLGCSLWVNLFMRWPLSLWLILLMRWPLSIVWIQVGDILFESWIKVSFAFKEK